MSINKPLTFDDCVTANYLDFENSVNKGLVSLNNEDLGKKKVLEKYNKWVDKIAELNPQEYTTSSIEGIDSRLFSELCSELVTKVFGEKMLEEFYEFTKVLNVSNSSSLLDGVCLVEIDSRSNKIVNMSATIPNIGFLSSVVSTMHEFSHYLCRKYKVNFNKKRYYEEVLSLYVEKYSVYYLSKISRDPEFVKKMESSRLNALVYHYKQKFAELDGVFKIYDYSRKMNTPDAKIIENHFADLIKSSAGRSIILGYEKCLADSYGIGYLFGDALYQHGMEDEQKLRGRLNNLIFEDKSFNELLRYYNISANDFSLYDKSYANAKSALTKKL